LVAHNDDVKALNVFVLVPILRQRTNDIVCKKFKGGAIMEANYIKANYIQLNSPQFNVLSSKQIEELHFASIQILENTGVTVDSEDAISLLGDAGANVSNPKRVKIPYRLVEQALRTTPKNVTLYTREGRPYIFLNGTHTYFGGVPDCYDILDPYTRKRRPCFAEDVASLVRLIDFLPNITWLQTGGVAHGLPGELSEKVVHILCVLNTSKPVVGSAISATSLKSMLEICSIISGGLEELKARPFFCNSVEPITPLVHGKDAIEMSLLCAEIGIPNVIYSMLMAGATSPATFAGTLAVANAEILSHLVVVQLKNPGAPVIYGGEPNIMDMRTMTFPYGAPELSLHTACLTELCHYYKLPMFGIAGATDAKIIGAEAGAEVMHQCLMSSLSGADLVHGAGLMDHCTMISPELIVLTDETIDMLKVSMGGVEINDQTLALDLIDKVGPGGNYLAEPHTVKHFRKFWVPRFMDRTQWNASLSTNAVTHCEDLVNNKTKEIMDTHIPRPLAEDIVREIRKIEESWFKELKLPYEYPKRQA
jgi:trimethylamine--corrinoid protein Co-methyltransferase